MAEFNAGLAGHAKSFLDERREWQGQVATAWIASRR
jgi:hypothetical protein